MAFSFPPLPSTQSPASATPPATSRRLIAAGEDGWPLRAALRAPLSGPATLTSPPPAATPILTLTGTSSGTADLSSAPPLAHGLALEYSPFRFKLVALRMFLLLLRFLAWFEMFNSVVAAAVTSRRSCACCGLSRAGPTRTGRRSASRSLPGELQTLRTPNLLVILQTIGLIA